MGASKGENDESAARQACAAAVVVSVPPVMWFIRRQVGKYKAKGLSVGQYRILCMVSRAEGTSLSEVADNLGMGLPMVSRTVLKLSDRGFLKMVSCEDDRRRKKLALTKTGQGVVDASQDFIRAAVGERLSGLSAKQCADVTSALELIQSVCSPTPATKPDPDEAH